jgi:hypothetical protein
VRSSTALEPVSSAPLPSSNAMVVPEPAGPLRGRAPPAPSRRGPIQWGLRVLRVLRPVGRHGIGRQRRGQACQGARNDCQDCRRYTLATPCLRRRSLG